MDVSVKANLSAHDLLVAGACNSGLVEFFDKHEFDYLCFDVQEMMEVAKDHGDDTETLERVANLNGYGYGDGKGYGYGYGDGYGDGNGYGNGGLG